MLLAVDPNGDSEKGVDANISVGSANHNVAFAHGYANNFFSIGEESPPFGAFGPSLVGAVKEHRRVTTIARLTSKKRAMIVEASFIVEEGIRKVERTIRLPIVKLDSNSVVGSLVQRPNVSDEVNAKVSSAWLSTPWRRRWLKRFVDFWS